MEISKVCNVLSFLAKVCLWNLGYMSVAIYPNLCHLAVPQMLLLCILPFGTRQPQLNIWDKNVSTQILFFLKIFQLFPKNRNYPLIIAVALVTNWCCSMLWYLVSALSNPDHGCPVDQNKVFKTIFKWTETSTQDILVVAKSKSPAFDIFLAVAVNVYV